MLTNNDFRKRLLSLYGTKSTKKAMLAILKNWFVFILMYTICGFVWELSFYPAILLYILVSFLAGASLRGFDNLTHESSHYNIFKTHSLHESLQFLYSYPVFKTVQDYRPDHMKHHRNYRSHKDDDPDTQQNIRWGVEDLPSKIPLRLLVWFYVTRLLTFYYTVDTIKYSLLPHLKSRNSRAGRMLFWGIIIVIVIVSKTWIWFISGYLVPLFVWLPYIRFITESSKHTNVRLQEEFANSRNNIGLIHQYILHPHNDGFHQMHHFMASIPFYNLKKAYLFLKREMQIQQSVIESLNPIQTIKQSYKII